MLAESRWPFAEVKTIQNEPLTVVKEELKERVTAAKSVSRDSYCMLSVNMMAHKFLPLWLACFVHDIDLPCPQQCLFILAITQSGLQLHAPSI